MSDTQAADSVEHASPLPFDTTVERLAQAIADRGMTIFARIDHAANARALGVTMPRATVLIHGSPAGGTPIMLETPAAAMLCRAGVPQDAAARLEPAQRMLLAAIAP